MRVAVQDIQGVASVDVSLNDGVAAVTMHPNNQTPVAAIRRAIRENGFSPKDAEVRITGTIEQTGDGLVLESGGTKLRLAAHPDAGTVALGDHVSARVEVRGVVPESDGDHSALRLLVRSVHRVEPRRPFSGS